MRIGIYTPYLDTLTGGEKYILTLASCLAKNHEVSFFWDKETDVLREKIVEKFGEPLSKIKFVDNIFDSRTSFQDRFLASKAYDRIIVLSDGSIPLVWPKLYIHFQTPMEWVEATLKTKLKLLKVEKVVCNSLFTKHYIDAKFGVHSTVIYPPIALSDTKIGKKENIILNVGRYGITHAGSSYKKQEILVDAFRKLVDAGNKNWEFVLVVSIFEQDKDKLVVLKDSIKNYPITLLVNPTNEDLWKLYGKAKIYWHAAGFGEDLHDHPDRAEHFGMATVEAMGAGAVPVVIDAGGQKEIVENDKNGFLWSSEEELCNKTAKLIQDPSLLDTMGQAAKQRAKQFGTDRFCEEWEKIIL